MADQRYFTDGRVLGARIDIQKMIESEKKYIEKIKNGLDDNPLSTLVELDLKLFSFNKKALSTLTDSMRVIQGFAKEHQDNDFVLKSYGEIKKKSDDIIKTNKFTKNISEIIDAGISLINSVEPSAFSKQSIRSLNTLKESLNEKSR